MSYGTLLTAIRPDVLRVLKIDNIKLLDLPLAFLMYPIPCDAYKVIVLFGVNKFIMFRFKG